MRESRHTSRHRAAETGEHPFEELSVAATSVPARARSPVIASPQPSPQPSPQLSFDELGTPLREVTFVVLDLETTGGSARADAITEIGAVKVRGGEQLGELATLVDPGVGLSPTVVALTGITTAMVSGAPRLPAVLPSVLEFLSGSVLVAHNAPFDSGFLKAACARHDQVWPRPPVLCTARLARAVLSRDEAPSVRLGALASCSAPARAPATGRSPTRAPPSRCCTTCSNGSATSACRAWKSCSGSRASRRRTVPPSASASKRVLAEGVPSAPGVYLFRGARDEVLYVGTSGDLRRRVRSYFTAGERRRRVRDMVALAERVDTVVCAHALEAAVRELRLIAAHQPRYNRRSRRPHHTWWIAATDEAFPRLSVVSHATGRRARAVPLAAGGCRRPSRRSSTPCRCAPAPSASRPATPGPPRARCTSWAAAPRPCAGLQSGAGVRPRGRGARGARRGHRPTTRCAASPPASTRSRRGSASRPPRATATGSRA